MLRPECRELLGRAEFRGCTRRSCRAKYGLSGEGFGVSADGRAKGRHLGVRGAALLTIRLSPTKSARSGFPAYGKECARCGVALDLQPRDTRQQVAPLKLGRCVACDPAFGERFFHTSLEERTVDIRWVGGGPSATRNVPRPVYLPHAAATRRSEVTFASCGARQGEHLRFAGFTDRTGPLGALFRNQAHRRISDIELPP